MSHASHIELSVRQNKNHVLQQLELLHRFLPLVTHLLHELDWRELSADQKRSLDAPVRELANALLLSCTITYDLTQSYPELPDEIPF